MTSQRRPTLPDTEPMTESQESEPFFSQPVQISWGRLFCKYIKNETVELNSEVFIIGRDKTFCNYVFKETEGTKKMFEKASKLHFKVELKDYTHNFQGMNNPGITNPVILTVLGQNGLLINSDKLERGAQRILLSGDTIRLTKALKLFIFQDQRINSDICVLPQAIREKYFMSKKLGAGGCGVVQLIYNIRTLDKFAMKIVKKNNVNNTVGARRNDDHNQKILNEVNIMKRISHRNVVTLYETIDSKEAMYMVIEHMEGGDLLHRIIDNPMNPDKRLPEDTCKFYFYQICLAIKHLHACDIIHRDIKPDNILMANGEKETLVKISDFGLSKYVALNSMKTVCGTQYYAAPEILGGGHNSYDAKVDVWSLGVLLFTMISGSLPFSEAYERIDVSTQILKSPLRFRQKIWRTVNPQITNLIKRMLTKDPRQRPSIADVLNHPWMTERAMFDRIQRFYGIADDTIIGDDENDDFLNITLINVSLNETSDKLAHPPPAKKRRVD
ncbi:unnamed protein product [Diamesa tonsa]